MKTLRRVAQDMDVALGKLPPALARQLERWVVRLSCEQLAFVRDALEHACVEERLSPGKHALLEHCFERWCSHSLATKLALISLVDDLADSHHWPDDSPRGYVTSLLARRPRSSRPEA